MQWNSNLMLGFLDPTESDLIMFNNINIKMYNQSLENNQLGKAGTHKYSLRQKMAHHKNKNELMLLPNYSNQDLLSNHHHEICR